MSNNNKRNALGRGLSALLENSSTDITANESKPFTLLAKFLFRKYRQIRFNPEKSLMKQP